MKKVAFIVIVFSLLIACKKTIPGTGTTPVIPFKAVVIDTIFREEVSIRAIYIDSNKIWYAGNKGRYGYRDLNSSKHFNGSVINDTLQLEFRSIAGTTKNIFILNVGSPAQLYRIAKDGSRIEVVYTENHPKVFYDSMQFWDDNDGIAIGDPTEDCLSIIITRDGGNSWKKIPCDQLPKINEGEAAFAASNTNIVVKGNVAWVVSGGKKSRVFYSPDKGNSWKVYGTPIVQGQTMTGIFTADFYNSTNGIIAGGNYEIPNQNHSNKAVTTNGGKTWNLIAEHQGFGYASCIQYVPGSNGKGLVCVGASGVFYSADNGQSWKQLYTDKELFTIRFQNDSTAIAAGKNKIVRIAFKK
ncbi:MAG TPA: oxidoreductase [Flavobacterium sp.]|jgi:photosystem II stability/assembly factor-like uncharacterized protein